MYLLLKRYTQCLKFQTERYGQKKKIPPPSLITDQGHKNSNCNACDSAFLCIQAHEFDVRNGIRMLNYSLKTQFG